MRHSRSGSSDSSTSAQHVHALSNWSRPHNYRPTNRHRSCGSVSSADRRLGGGLVVTNAGGQERPVAKGMYGCHAVTSNSAACSRYARRPACRDVADAAEERARGGGSRPGVQRGGQRGVRFIVPVECQRPNGPAVWCLRALMVRSAYSRLLDLVTVGPVGDEIPVCVPLCSVYDVVYAVSQILQLMVASLATLAQLAQFCRACATSGGGGGARGYPVAT